MLPPTEVLEKMAREGSGALDESEREAVQHWAEFLWEGTDASCDDYRGKYQFVLDSSRRRLEFTAPGLDGVTLVRYGPVNSRDDVRKFVREHEDWIPWIKTKCLPT